MFENMTCSPNTSILMNKYIHKTNKRVNKGKKLFALGPQVQIDMFKHLQVPKHGYIHSQVYIVPSIV